MARIINRKQWRNCGNVFVVVILSVLLSNTLAGAFTSMLAFKSRVEVKDYEISDFYNAVANSDPKRKMSENVVMVSVDNLSRKEIAEVVEFIKKANPKSIGVDILFDYKYEEDSALIEAVTAPNIVMPVVLNVSCDSVNSISYFSCCDTQMDNLGVVNMEDGMVRNYRMQYGFHGDTILSFASALLYKSGMDNNYGSSVNIYYPTIDFYTFGLSEIKNKPELCKDFIEDKIVLVGDIYNVKDMHNTAIGKMSGLQIHASAIETVVGKHNVTALSGFWNWIVAIISCIILISLKIYFSERKKIWGQMILRIIQLLFLYLFYMVGCSLFVNTNVCFDFAPVLTTIAVSFLVYDVWMGFVDLLKKIIKKNNI